VGAILFITLVVAPAPSGLGDAEWSVVAIGVLMVVWWVTEAIPLAATALVPVVFLPLLGVKQIDEAAQPYAHPLIILFLGGFLIAKALEKWELHRRIASILMRIGPGGPAGLIGSLMAATAFLSMWISNTATAMVMVPIAQSIIQSLRQKDVPVRGLNEFAAALMLAIAFSATIGGMATLIGTPPNALLAGYMQSSHGIDIGFGTWMMLGLPVALVLLPMTWLILTRLLFDVGQIDKGATRDLLNNAPTMSEGLPLGARLTAGVVTLAAIALVLRPFLQNLLPSVPLSDAGIAMGAALLLFVIPAGDGGKLLDWNQAQTIRWDVLILFGGGLALAAVIDDSGISLALGNLFSSFGTLPLPLVILLTMAAIVLIGELASNTAMAAVFLPIAGATAVGLGSAPLDLVLPVGLAASLGFMLPVATPPNAIAYGSGEVSSQQMLKAGAVLDVISILVVYTIAVTIGRWVFAI